MEIILREDVPNLGHAGTIVNVKPGYGRNYLLPRGLAVVADKRNVNKLEHEKAVIAARESKRMKTAEAVKERIEGLSINIPKNVGEDDKIFGSVTTREIAELLAAEGVTISKKVIKVKEPIKRVGVHQVTVHLARDVAAELKVWVVAKED